MEKKTKLNVELFKKIRERIATIPESYDQSQWAVDSEVAPCGTAACLAGKAVICASANVKAGIRRVRRLRDIDAPYDPRVNPQVFDSKVPLVAAKLLGLNPEHHAIFEPDARGWPKRFRNRFRKARGTKGRAGAAVAYLDHIIETGKVLD